MKRTNIYEYADIKLLIRELWLNSNFNKN
jgi:hypothetical protein